MNKENSKVESVNIDDMCGNKPKDIPKGWVVFRLNQTPTFCLWYCCLFCLFPDEDMDENDRIAISEECDTMLDAINQAIAKIKKPG